MDPRGLTSLRSTPIMKCFLQKSSLREYSILSAIKADNDWSGALPMSQDAYAGLEKVG